MKVVLMHSGHATIKLMKQFLKKTAKILGWIGGAALFLLVISGITHAIATKFERDSLKESYGQPVTIDGGNVHVDVQGQGERVVVLLPGLGVSAPAIEFKPLLDNLKKDYTVVVYEGFGYGLSDDTSKPRTTDNIVSEIHQTLAKLGYDKYSLVAHSVSGIYALKYVQLYTDEVEAVLGIETSVPDMYDFMPQTLIEQMPDTKSTKMMVASLHLAGFFGLPRVYIAFNQNSTTDFEKVGYSFDQDEKRLINALTARNWTSNAVLDETVRSTEPVKGLTATTQFPNQIPVKFFLAQTNQDMFPKWKELHAGQIAEPKDTSVTVLPGEHFLYHTQHETIAQGLRELLPPTR